MTDGEAAARPRQNKYWAFISYSHADEPWAKWLHRALETYRVPKHLKRIPTPREEPLPQRLNPIFRDSDELAGSSNLGAKLEEALSNSRALIVICSPNAARSVWVNREIEHFQAAGGADRVFAVIVDGELKVAEPARDPFPPALRARGIEPLACDPRDDRDGKHNARLRLVAGLLSVDFDQLKQRDRMRGIRRAVVLSLAGVVLLAVLGTLLAENTRRSHIAESRRFAVQSQDLVDQDPVRALELAIASAVKAPTVEAGRALSTALTHQLMRTVFNHASRVASASFSPDGRRVLTCAADGVARVWDVDSGHLLVQFNGTNGAPRRCLFSPDGASVLTIMDSAAPMIWNAQSGQLTLTLSGHSGGVFTGGFSPDGSRIVTGGEDKTARVWDAKSGEQTLIFERHDTPVVATFFFSDSARVVSVGSEGKAFAWDTSTGETMASFGEQVPMVQDAVLAPDGSRMLISNYQYSADLWNPVSGEKIQQLTTRSLGAAFSKDSGRLVTGSGDGRVTVWDAQDGSMIKELPHSAPVDSVLISPDGSLVLTAGDQPHIWDMPELGGGAESERFSLRGHNADTELAGFSASGTLLLTIGRSDRTVRVWDLARGADLRTFGAPDQRVHTVAFSRDGAKLLTSGDKLQIWSRDATRLLATAQAPVSFQTWSETWSANGRILGNCYRRSACVIDETSGALVTKFDNVDTLIMALSADGSKAVIAGSGSDNVIDVYDLPSGKRVAVLSGGEHAPSRLLFAPDGSHVLIGIEKTVVVKESSTGRDAAKLAGYGATFSPDGALVATVARDTVRWYRQADWSLVREVKIAADAIETIAFSPDGAWFAAGSTDGVIALWNVSSGTNTLNLRPLDGRVRVLQFTKDARSLVGVTNGAIHCYDTADGGEWMTLRHNFGLVNSAVAPDGLTAIASDTSGRAHLFSFRLEDLLATARAHLPAMKSTP